MEIIVIIAVGVLFIAYIIVGAKKEKEKKIAEQKKQDQETLETVALIRKDLEEKNAANNERIDTWKEWREKYADLGEPTTYVGFSAYNGWPWERQHVTLHFDDRKSPSNQLDDVLSGDACMIPYMVPSLFKCAIFFKDARIAFIGGTLFKPEEIRFVKSRTDKVLEKIIVTMTTTNLDFPTFQMEFELDDRETVDELKAAITAFKMLPAAKQ